MDESRDDVTILQVEVVMRSKDIGRDDAGEHTAILLVVSPARDGYTPERRERERERERERGKIVVEQVKLRMNEQMNE